MNQPIRIGEILIEQRVLSEQQVFEITQAQKRQHQPFGVLAEQLFDVTLDSIEGAWVEQYHRFTGTIDLDDESVDLDALAVLNRRQAWQFQILPLRIEPGGELLIAAARDRLARAVTFATNRIERVAYFRIAEPDQLRLHLRQHYAMPEVPDAIRHRALSLPRSA